MSPSTKTARIALSFLTLLLLSGLVAFGSSPASSYGLAYEGSFVYSLDGNGNTTLESIAFDKDEYTLLYGAKLA